MSTAYKNICIVGIGIIINLCGCFLAYKLELPFFLDMIGTALATFYGGVWCWGSLTSFFWVVSEFLN